MQRHPDPPHNPKPHPAHRAAQLVWLIAAVELILSTATILVLWTAPIPLEPARQAAQDLAASVITFIVLPGALLLALGFPVRSRKTTAIVASLAVTITQCAVLAILFTKQLLITLTNPSPADVTLVILVYGTPIGALTMCIRQLILAWPTSTKPNPQSTTQTYQSHPIH